MVYLNNVFIVIVLDRFVKFSTNALCDALKYIISLLNVPCKSFK